MSIQSGSPFIHDISLEDVVVEAPLGLEDVVLGVGPAELVAAEIEIGDGHAASFVGLRVGGDGISPTPIVTTPATVRHPAIEGPASGPAGPGGHAGPRTAAVQVGGGVHPIRAGRCESGPAWERRVAARECPDAPDRAAPFTLAERLCSSPPSDSPSSSPSSCRRAGCSCTGAWAGGSSSSAPATSSTAGWDWRFVPAAGRLDVGQPGTSRTPIHRADGEPARKALAGRRGRRQPRLLGYFKYYGFFVTLRHRACCRRVGIDVARAAACRSCCRSASRSSRSRRSATSSTSTGGDAAPALAARLRGLPVVLPAPRRRPDRAGARVPAPARRARRPAATSTPALAFWLIVGRPVQEGRDLELPGAHHRRPGVRLPAPAPRASRCCSGSTATRCRSTPTSRATPTSPSASRCSSASASPRTSTRPTPRCRSRTSGGAGT